MNNIINKGILLAGGHGTRFRPFTNYINKHLLPLYNKPVIFYPLANLLQAGIREILIITNPKFLHIYKKLFGNGNHLGINISYKIQNKPVGLPDAFIIGEKFIQKKPICLNLGDHILYGQTLEKILKNTSNDFKLTTIFSIVSDQIRDSGVPFYYKNNLKKILEKPKKNIGNRIICGLYFYDTEVVQRTKLLKKSKRKELEITDLNNSYIKDKKINLIKLDKKIKWHDAGDTLKLFNAAKEIERYQKKNEEVAFLEKIALNNKFINLREYNNLLDNKL